MSAMYTRLRCHNGYSLVELMVTMVIFGTFSAAVYTMYITQLKTKLSRDDLIDVQQYIRIAMERMGRDIINAGLFVTPAIDKTLSNYSTITIQTTPLDLTKVTISQLLTEQNENLKVTKSGTFDMTAGDRVVILRPATKAQIASSTRFNILSVRSSATSTPRLVITPTPAYPDVPVLGDMLFKLYTTSATAPSFPQKVRYAVNRTDTTHGCDVSPCLVRSFYTKNGVWNTDNIIAQGVTSIRFDYFFAGTNTMAADPAAAANSVNTLSDDTIKTLSGLGISVTGQTVPKSGSNSAVKTLGLKSLVKLRNYR